VTQACLDAVYGAANVDAGVAKLCAAVEMYVTFFSAPSLACNRI